ncbi:Cytochrome P450 [Metarhizium rileyi]|uniref:Cytochrome P450 n=1 Tax=Metarhizium rileyi (strain RCEF 4871) TaxID=1649241 RepID=A0A162J1V7_METRR|nr:Cytochrome P450 [Metarhizium rileyi RCEF 4871]
MTDPFVAGVVFVFTIITFCLYSIVVRERDIKSRPPGPKGVPVLGNIRDFPPKGVPEFKHWLLHKDLYGPMSSVRVLGQTIILIHDRDAAHEVLTKSSSKTSDRPASEFATNLCGYDRLFVLRGDDKRFRRCRKLVHQHLGTKTTAAKFDHDQNLATHQLLLRLLTDPDGLFNHVGQHSSGTVLRITYGYTISETKKDPLVALIDCSSHQLGQAGVPGAWTVDIIPALKYLPSWFPGAGFQKTAKQFRKVAEQMANVPYRFVQQHMASGTHKESFVSGLIKQLREETTQCETLTARDEDEIKSTAAVMYLAGAETIVTAIRVFILCMILYPEVQREAQEEIDRVLGPNQLPSASDLESLPYIDALVKESYRWSPAVPLGLAHCTSEELWYDGYTIPKGAIIMPAVWYFLHDPHVYDTPDRFDPSRFLEPRNQRDPRSDVFGYGRRQCPGRFLAHTFLFLTFAQILASFDIRKAVDEQGRDMDVKLELGSGIGCFPKEHPYAITPRSEAHADMIRRVAAGRLNKAADTDYLHVEAILQEWE